MCYGSSQKNYPDFLNETIETYFNFEETSEETVLGLLKKIKKIRIPKVMTKFPIQNH